MEFKVYQKELELQSRGWIPTFHDVSREVVEIVKESGIKNGTVCIASHHTTCSVMIQECSHDIDSFDLEYLQHDLLDIMRKMIPDFAEEHQYRHPGPIHTQFGRYVDEPGDFTSMNTDGHLRSVFFGRSETMTIKDGVLDGGEFAHIYFIDWDHVRARHRQLNVTVMGTTEDVNDRKFHGGQTINTLRKYTDEEKKPTTSTTPSSSTRESSENIFSSPEPGQPGPGDFFMVSLLTSAVYSCRIALYSTRVDRRFYTWTFQRSMRANTASA